jgi:hypothetical protein
VDFTWEAPEGCPDKPRVVAEIERLIRRSINPGVEPRVSVHAVVMHSERGFSVHIASRSEGTPPDSAEGGTRVSEGSESGALDGAKPPASAHERTVDAPTCAEAADAAALIIAMALDPALDPAFVPLDQTPPGRASQPTASQPAAAPSPAANTASEAPPVAAQAPPLRFEARATLLVDAGALPSPAPGLGAAAGLWVGRFRFETTGAYFPAQRRALAEGGGDIGLGVLGLDAWFAPVLRPLEIHAGLGLEAGALWGNGFGVTGARSGSTLWLAARLGFGAAYAITARLGALVAAHAVLPLLRDRFLLGSAELFVPGSVSLRLAAGLFVRFP